MEAVGPESKATQPPLINFRASLNGAVTLFPRAIIGKRLLSANSLALTKAPFFVPDFRTSLHHRGDGDEAISIASKVDDEMISAFIVIRSSSNASRTCSCYQVPMDKPET